MQLLKLVTSCAQTLGAWNWEFMVVWPFSFWARGWSTGAAAALDPPLNHPPTAWPIEEPTATPLNNELAIELRMVTLGCGDLRSSAGHLAEETATAARCGCSLLRSGRRGSVLVGRRLSDSAGLASLCRLLRRRARLRSRNGGTLGRRGGTAGLARHDCRFVRWYLCSWRCCDSVCEV